jgi:3-deoxy-D-manno-octulosonic-acid transferase
MQKVENPDVLLVDTTGELRNFYAVASVIFVGKSLTQHGGQNIIEPAACAKPVLVGPNMENFESIVPDFLAAQALVQVKDAGELRAAVARLLQNPAEAQALGARAAAVVQSKAGALRATVQQLLPLLG